MEALRVGPSVRVEEGSRVIPPEPPETQRRLVAWTQQGDISGL